MKKYIKALWDAFVALIHPSAQIAMNVPIGAGAVVVKDLGHCGTYIGVLIKEMV